MAFTSTLNPALIDRAFRKTPTPQTTKTPPTFPYDAARYDEPLEGMFGRIWDDMDVFPPRAKEIWNALFRCTIGGTFSLDEVSMLLAVAENTKSESLRRRAIGGLDDYLRDCSGTDVRLKPAVQQLLTTLKEPNVTQP